MSDVDVKGPLMQTAAMKANASPYTKRAQYHDPENAFLFKWTPVPRRQFLSERDQAMDPLTGTAEIPLDSSDALVLDYPATTPIILCRYLRLHRLEIIDRLVGVVNEVHNAHRVES